MSGQPQSLARATTGEEREAWLGKIEELVVAELAAGATEIDIPGDAAGAERNSTAIGGDGRLQVLLEYDKGWDGWSGTIPTDRKDMWTIFYNYYLNDIQDVDRRIQLPSSVSRYFSCARARSAAGAPLPNL